MMLFFYRPCVTCNKKLGVHHTVKYNICVAARPREKSGSQQRRWRGEWRPQPRLRTPGCREGGGIPPTNILQLRSDQSLM